MFWYADSNYSYNYTCNFVDENIECKLENVMGFFSGSAREPPCGFHLKPYFTFQHESLYPTASMCTLELRLPTVHISYEKLKEAMVLGIMGNDGFGVQYNWISCNL